jgi:hypothetical protein
MEQISEELKYAPVVNNHSTTAFRKISLQGISTGITLSSASSQGPSEFVLPPSTMNLAKSRLNFQLSIAAQSATFFPYIDANLLSVISRVVLYDTNTNAVWLDCSNFEKYAALTVPAGTSYDDFKTKATAWQSDTFNRTLATTSPVSQPFPCEDIQKSNALVNFTLLGTETANAADGFNSYEGRRYTIGGGGADGATSNGAAVLNVSIPFNAFKFTALALDKQIYNPSNLVLQIYWNATNNFGYKGTNAPTATVAAAVAFTGAVTINDLSVQLATEQNLTLISKIQQQVMSSGISIPIAYPTTTRQSIARSSQHSYQLNLTKGYGQRILAIISACFNAQTTPGTDNTINGNNSHIRGTLTTYNTFMNNIAVKYPNGLDCRLGEDFYVGNREYHEKSVVQSVQDYAVGDWVHIDSFFGEKPLHKLDMTQIDGYDVGSTASTWSIQASLSNDPAATWVSAIIGQKMLTLSSQGSMVA